MLDYDNVLGKGHLTYDNPKVIYEKTMSIIQIWHLECAYLLGRSVARPGEYHGPLRSMEKKRLIPVHHIHHLFLEGLI